MDRIRPNPLRELQSRAPEISRNSLERRPHLGAVASVGIDVGEVLESLRNYVREWSVALRDWRASPWHDWASHGAGALRIFPVGHTEPVERPLPLACAA